MRKSVIAAVCGAMCYGVALQAEASVHYFQFGEGTTGFNRQLGAPIWVYPNLEYLTEPPFNFPPFITLAGFRTSGRFDPLVGEGGGNSPAWTPADSMDALMATHYDADFMPVIGTLPEHVPDDVLNVHIDNVRTLSNPDGIQFEAPPCADASGDPDNITKAAPCDLDGLTVGEWIGAQGFSHFHCRDDGTAEITMIGWNMRPNRLYSTWFVKENAVLGPDFVIHGVPMGGVPNVVVANAWGSVVLRRELDFCPNDEADALGYVFAFRSNGTNSGGVPTVFTNQGGPEPFSGYEGYFPGGNIHVHVSWNLGGVPFEP